MTQSSPILPPPAPLTASPSRRRRRGKKMSQTISATASASYVAEKPRQSVSPHLFGLVVTIVLVPCAVRVAVLPVLSLSGVVRLGLSSHAGQAGELFVVDIGSLNLRRLLRLLAGLLLNSILITRQETRRDAAGKQEAKERNTPESRHENGPRKIVEHS